MAASPRLHPLIAPAHVVHPRQTHFMKEQPRLRRVVQTRRTRQQWKERGQFQHHFRVSRQLASWTRIERHTHRRQLGARHVHQKNKSTTPLRRHHRKTHNGIRVRTHLAVDWLELVARMVELSFHVLQGVLRSLDRQHPRSADAPEFIDDTFVVVFSIQVIALAQAQGFGVGGIPLRLKSSIANPCSRSLVPSGLLVVGGFVQA